MTEDQVRQIAKQELGFNSLSINNVNFGIGQTTTFNQLDNINFKGIKNRPDGWYLPLNTQDVAVIFEFKSSDKNVNKKIYKDEILRNIKIINQTHKQTIGVIYNSKESVVFKNKKEIKVEQGKLNNINYYLHLFDTKKIDKNKIYQLTKQINDKLHIDFGMSNLYHRMIFTACALIAKQFGAAFNKNSNYEVFKKDIETTLSKALEDDKNKNPKLQYLLDVFSDIRMNAPENKNAINIFIECVTEISKNFNSQFWNGEDVMGIFFNEFNRYKKKSEQGQVFTPDHITSFMCRLLNVSKNDVILDATCGSGAFLVQAMCKMIGEVGGESNEILVQRIKETQLYGIENNKIIFALACANMLIHKDGKTNLAWLDTRSEEACKWIREKSTITKVLMNPPFEEKYGCMKIVANVLDNVPVNTLCAFILPDTKLETRNGKELLKKHTLTTIIKLPENIFDAHIKTAIFIFKSKIPQNDQMIIGYHIEDDQFERVKNQGRHDITQKWLKIENYWIKAIQTGEENKFKTKQIINPNQHLSYQMPKGKWELSEKDFLKTALDYEMFEQNINAKKYKEELLNEVIYNSTIESEKNGEIKITLGKNKTCSV